MLRGLSHRLLPVLQLTRMALVFTAIADGQTELLLHAHRLAGSAGDLRTVLHPMDLLAILMSSVGLYGFGMSLNDIIDRRRDSLIAAHRPLPSGRVRLATAHVICAGLILLALAGSLIYSARASLPGSVYLVILTASLISFYDLAGKYLVALGLLSLGLIRFFHCLVPAPDVPLLWHPLLLLNHVSVLSVLSYHWEQKRPALSRVHWASVLGGLAAMDALAIGIMYRRRGWDALWLRPELLIPLALVAGFVGVAVWVRRTAPTSRDAGQRLMLYGLLWLIAYDAAFVAIYTHHALATLAILMLLPLAYGAVQFMRWWAGVIAVSQRPAFRRAKT